MTKQLHLLGFIQHGVNSHATGMWRHPKDKVGWDYARPEYWQHLARTMERGLFDGVFIADELAPYTTYENSSDAIVKYAVQCPTHEPSTIVPIITTATEKLGVGLTLSTAFEHPVLDVPAALQPRPPLRRALRVEHRQLLLQERVGGLRPRDDRARRPVRPARGVHGALLQALGLLGAGRDHRRQGDRASTPIRPRSTRSSTKASTTRAAAGISSRRRRRAVRSCGRPGSSGRGRDFAAKHAEAIFAVHPNVERMREYTDDLDQPARRRSTARKGASS